MKIETGTPAVRGDYIVWTSAFGRPSSLLREWDGSKWRIHRSPAAITGQPIIAWCGPIPIMKRPAANPPVEYDL